jgi:hypothetical protein
MREWGIVGRARETVHSKTARLQDCKAARLQGCTRLPTISSVERRLFAANAHEYLITQCQLQKQTSAATSIAPSGALHAINIDLKFNHPVSHLFWVLQRPESEYAREWFRYEATHGAGDPLMISAQL